MSPSSISPLSNAYPLFFARTSSLRSCSGSVMVLLVSGQAAAFDEAMTRRDDEMNDASVRAAQLEPVEDIPEAFMGEVLDTDMKNYVLSLYAEYYQKDSVTLQKKE